MPVYQKHPEYDAAKGRWLRCRDAAGGADAVKLARTAYLPLLEGHDDQNGKGYSGYSMRALYYPALSRTVQGLLGLVFGKPVSLENVPKAYENEFDDVTLSGVKLSDYARGLGREVLITGRAGILVDMSAKPNVGTVMRPYWSTYPAEAIINWRKQRIDGLLALTRVVLYEEVYEPDPEDEFVDKVKKQYRVLQLIDGKYVVRIYVENVNKATPTVGKREEWIQEGKDWIPTRRGKPLPYIPFVIVNSDSVDACVSYPPLLDLADVNFSHYRTSADQEHGAHFTALPTPFVSGMTLEAGQELAIGSGTAWILPDPAARAGMVEFSGAGLKALADLKEEKRQLMVTLGARMLETQKNVQEAAATVAMRHAGERSALAVLGDALGQALTIAIKWHLYWNGVEDAATDKVTFSLNPEVMDLVTTADVAILVSAWQAGAISHKTLYANLEYGEWTRQDVTFDEEVIDIEAEQPELPLVDDLGNPVPPIVGQPAGKKQPKKVAK